MFPLLLVVVLGFNMACLYPRVAYYDTRVSPARVLFQPLPIWSAMDRLPEGVQSISIPCGKCFGCLKSRALGITVRAVAESRMHFASSFITLTVDDENLPLVFPHGLCHRPWQLFAKRLRKAIGSFSFLMCGEYGSHTDRPHYHACIYGHKFVDSFVDADGYPRQSRILADCWPYGNHMVGDLNSNRAAYVAGYTCKDFVRGRNKDWYINRHLGPSYVRWSRRPSLGLRWLQKFWRELIDDDFNFSFVIDGKSFNFGCRYFFEKFSLLMPAEFDKIKAVRRERLLNEDAITGIMRHQDNLRACELKQYNLKRKKELASL